MISPQLFIRMPLMLNTESIERYWDPRGVDYQALFDMSPRTHHAYNQPDQPLVVVCIDEGMPKNVINVAFIAGSGILEESLDLSQIQGLTSHEGCGAARLSATNTKFEGNPDEFGHTYAKDTAKRLAIPYEGVITAEDMTRPTAFHIADTFYLDGTREGFNPNVIQHAPVGFVHSRGIFGDPEIGKRQMDLGIAIATGAHGFGDRFTPDNPFNIVVITDKKPGSVPQGTLLAEAREVMNGNLKIKIHTVTLKSR